MKRRVIEDAQEKRNKKIMEMKKKMKDKRITE